MLNRTHDPKRKCWVESANQSGCDFPLQNLPHGVFCRGDEPARGGMAIGDQILDLRAVVDTGFLKGETLEIARAAAEPSLNRYMAMASNASSLLRAQISELLDAENRNRFSAQASQLLIPMKEARMQVPVHTRSFSDFCTSVPHVSANRRARPGRPLHHAMKHLPVAYAGRASSIVIDGTPVLRPYGQGADEANNEVYFAPTRRLDFELEFGAYLSHGNELGTPIPMRDADRHIFGYVLVNDWSARDIQRFENLLGPFLGKSFCTSISPWIVTQEALAPFRCAPTPRAADDPVTKPHLTCPEHEQTGALDIQLEALLQTKNMREQGLAPQRITDTNLLHLYWTLPQMVAHHASNGCNLETGDLLASGTVSGPEEHQAACMWELTGGSLPLSLLGGESRLWLEDGDELILRARAEKTGCVAIGFGECRGRIQAAAMR